MPPDSFLLAFSYATLRIPLALPSVIVVSTRRQAGTLRVWPANVLAMDVFQSRCSAKTSLGLIPEEFPATLNREHNTTVLRHFFIE